MQRRHLLRHTAAGALLALATSTWAQDSYPSRPITLVVPQAAGSGSDLVARLLARELQREFNATVVVDNKPGGNGAIAAQAVARAAPDGYTLLMGTATTNAANFAFYPGKLGYEPGSFDVVGLLAASPMTVLVTTESPWKTVAELIADAKKQPGKLNCGAGLATAQVACELFAKLNNLQATTVNYRSSPQSLTDLAGGQVQYAIADMAVASGLVAGKKLRALAVIGPTREALWPDVPTLMELGMADVQITGWAGVFAPAGTPRAVLEKLNPVLIKANDAPEFVKSRASTGGRPLTFALPAAQQFVRAEVERWQRLFRDSGVKLEF